MAPRRVGCLWRGTHSASPALQNTELSPALQPYGWMVGTWNTGDIRETWVAADGAMYGIQLRADSSFDLAIIDDGSGPGPADGKIRFLAMPRGDAATETNKVPYSRDGDTMIHGDQRLSRVATESSESAELADNLFSKDVVLRGVEGWAAAFASDGAMLANTDKITDVAGAMKDLLAAGTLAWSPISSGQRGTTAFTIGKAQFTPTNHDPKLTFRSSYLTVWHKDASGNWKVFRDAGRATNASP